MKTNTSHLTVSLFTAALLGLSVLPAVALTVPVAQDSASSSANKLPGTNGKAATLAINAKQTTLLRFNLTDLDVVPNAFQPGNIKSATLRFYVVGAKSAAPITIHAITSDWQERFAGAPVSLPSINPAVLATVSTADIITKNYVNVDLTAAVINALGTGNIFGFALECSDPLAKITIASKEGTATGYSAELEIEANTATDGTGNITATTVTANVIGNLTGNVTGNVTGSANLTALTAGNSFAVQNHPNSTGTSNGFIGVNSGTANTSGSNNQFVGADSGSNNLGGGQNSFFGSSSGSANTAGDGNTFVGYTAGYYNKTGSSNTFLGRFTGSGMISESNNTFIGEGSGAVPGVNNSTALGRNSVVGISNAVALGTSTTNVGVRTSTPNSALQVGGSLSLPCRVVASSSLASLTDADYALVVTGNVATSVILPSPGIAGRVYVVKNRGSQAVNVGFVGGASTIDGNSTLSVPVNGAAQLISDGTSWYKIN